MKKLIGVLPVIVISQFCCTSLWFAGNGVMPELVQHFDLAAGALGHLTSAVQLGFIIGTLLFAVFTISDRCSPSRVFLISAILGSLFNLLVVWDQNTLLSLIALRFATGFFLAGIYPVGMKIASDHYKEGLGKSLGYLVGALVLGTAFPHFLKIVTQAFPWKAVLMATSGLAVLGGSLMIIFVPDGPYRKKGKRLKPGAFLKEFKNSHLRSAAFGYFGHMWELYTFWAFVPVLLSIYGEAHPGLSLNIPLLSFVIIGSGGIACVLGGYLAQQKGSRPVAMAALLASSACCLLSPFIMQIEFPVVFIAFLVFWGMVVVADSPLLSTLVARNATPENTGTALTIVNSIGFLITIVSIQLLTLMKVYTDSTYIYAMLAFGPILGIIALLKKNRVPAL